MEGIMTQDELRAYLVERMDILRQEILASDTKLDELVWTAKLAELSELATKLGVRT
jgi:hypothetical protein